MDKKNLESDLPSRFASELVRKRWKKTTKKERQEYASTIAKKRWETKTKEEKREHALKMVQAREAKREAKKKENKQYGNEANSK